jgi:cellulose synthase/poly-beta-1,6-N-acetylglucosamine synthase-like glycosyltransferase
VVSLVKIAKKMQSASSVRSLPRSAFHLPVDVAFLVDLGYRADFLAYARDQAAAQGVTCHEWLIAAGHIGEVRYYRALAEAVGLPFVDATRFELGPEARVLADPGLPYRTAALPLVDGGRWFVAIAPRGTDVFRVFDLHDHPEISRIVVTAPCLARGLILDRLGGDLDARACTRLSAQWPDLSAHATPWRLMKLALASALLLGAGVVTAIFAPAAASALTLGIVCAAIALFALALWVRMRALRHHQIVANSPRLSDADLPTYTVLVPLYREAAIVPQLCRALRRLDYPAAKLEIIALVEADDTETYDALRRVDRTGRLTVLVVPPGTPRTKPRALQFGLVFARGELVAIYDAEDIPAPDQLRSAAAAFAADPALSIVQAALSIDNARGWLTRQFAMEYASLFHVVVPGLARLDCPVMLGGTSNHFRADHLRAIGGWDPWNVTEDADLGVRLARAGGRVGVVPSFTEEEAPATLHGWLGQRRRWMKGWLQTAMVHLGHPIRLARDLRPHAALALTGMLLGTLAAALVYPFAWIIVAAQAWAIAAGAAPVTDIVFLGAIFVFVAGHIVPLRMIVAGARVTGLRIAWSDLMTVPAYWCLVSFAAWSALAALAVRPFHWVKTQHVGRLREAAPSKPVKAAHAASLPRGPDP